MQLNVALPLFDVSLWKQLLWWLPVCVHLAIHQVKSFGVFLFLWVSNLKRITYFKGNGYNCCKFNCKEVSNVSCAKSVWICLILFIFISNESINFKKTTSFTLKKHSHTKNSILLVRHTLFYLFTPLIKNLRENFSTMSHFFDLKN